MAKSDTSSRYLKEKLGKRTKSVINTNRSMRTRSPKAPKSGLLAKFPNGADSVFNIHTTSEETAKEGIEKSKEVPYHTYSDVHDLLRLATAVDTHLKLLLANTKKK